MARNVGEMKMLIREPLVHATYYYLLETPGDSAARRQERVEAFTADVRRTAQNLSSWLAIPVPELPSMVALDAPSSSDVQPLMPARVLEGRTDASALVGAYALRNMLLLRVMVMRRGEYEQTVWPLLDDVLGEWPTTPSLLYTTRYWCGIAPRPPEELEQDRSLPVKTPYGVLCLGREESPHLLIYPDARTETRASTFLQSLAVRLDWYPVQARYCLTRYLDRVPAMARNQQQALEQVTRSMPAGLQSLEPFRPELDALEMNYRTVLSDLHAVQAAGHELRALTASYRLALMQSGLWDAAPTVWEARVASLAEMGTQLESEVYGIDTTLRRIDTATRLWQTRLTLLHGERERLLIYLVAVLGLALLTVLIADTSPARMAVRLVALALVTGLLVSGWQYWQQKHPPS
jgi:hypothetical protein